MAGVGVRIYFNTRWGQGQPSRHQGGPPASPGLHRDPCDHPLGSRAYHPLHPHNCSSIIIILSIFIIVLLLIPSPQFSIPYLWMLSTIIVMWDLSDHQGLLLSIFFRTFHILLKKSVTCGYAVSWSMSHGLVLQFGQSITLWLSQLYKWCHKSCLGVFLSGMSKGGSMYQRDIMSRRLNISIILPQGCCTAASNSWWDSWAKNTNQSPYEENLCKYR